MFAIFTVWHLLVSSSFIIALFQIHWVSHCVQSNDTTPIILALKIAELFTFSLSQHEHILNIISFANEVLMKNEFNVTATPY